MSIYNVAAFGSEDDIVGDYYGEAPRLEYSADPFKATAISYTEASLTWATPAGDYTDIRIVRSNDGYPETQEDGAIIWSWNETSGLDKITAFTDGQDISQPLVSGRFVYYRIWLKVSDDSWKIAADSVALIPLRHSITAPDGTELVTTQNKVMDVLPRVFTTASQSPIDEPDPESALSRFMSAFSFELDRIQTYTELLAPLEANRLAGPAILLLQSLQLGLPIEPYLATKQQRRLAREALYIYQNKGTAKAIETFVESLTGFAPTVTSSPNLILTAQDSSFTNGVGFWRPVGDMELSLETTVPGVPPTTEPFVDDYRFTAKAVVNEIDARIVNGTDKPKTQGTPVVPGTPYTFSGYGKSASGSMDVYAYALWYDYEGRVVRVDPPRLYPVATQAIPDTDWTRYEFVGRAPGVTQYITNVDVESGVARVTVLPYNVMIPGNTVKISGVVTGDEAFDAVINGYHQIINVGTPGEDWLEIPLAALDESYVLTEGILQEAYPDLAGPEGTDNVYYTIINDPNATALAAAAAFTGVYYGIGAAAVVSGTATLVMDSVDGLSIGDVFLVQGVDATLSYGLHVLTGVDTGTNSVTFATTSPDVSYGPGALGFGMRVVPNAGTVTKPAYYAGFELVFKDTGTMYLDLLQMATYDVAEFHEARATEIFLAPHKSNFLKNPTFDDSTISTTWTIEAADYTASTTGAPLEVETHNAAVEASFTMTGYVSSSGATTIQLVETPTFSAGTIITIAGMTPDPIMGQHVVVAVDAGLKLVTVMTTLEDTAGTSYAAAVLQTLTMGGYAISSGVASVTLTSVPSYISTGDSIYIQSSPAHALDGYHVVTGVSTNVITFATTLADAAPSVHVAAVLPFRTSLSSITGAIGTGKFLTASVYAKTSVADTNETMVLNVTAGTDPVTPIASNSSVITITDEWQRFHVTVYVPTATAAGALLTLTGPTQGNTILLKEAQVENSFSPTDFIYGSMHVSYGAVWEGDEFDSTTHLYPGLAIKVTRLQQELEKYLPINSSFLIRWYDGRYALGGVAKPLL